MYFVDELSLEIIQDKGLGAEAENLLKLYQSGANTPGSFVVSISTSDASSEFSDEEVNESVERIGGFPVLIIDQKGSKVSSSSSDEVPLSENKICYSVTELQHEITESYRLLGLKSSGVSSVIVQKSIPAKFVGYGFTIDPYNGIEDRYFLEVYVSGSRAESGADPLAHSYSVRYDNNSVVDSDVGVGFVKFSDEVFESFGKQLLASQCATGRPQKVTFTVDRSGKVWILSSHDVSPTYYKGFGDDFVDMSCLSIDYTLGHCSPMMFSLLEHGFKVAVIKYAEKLGRTLSEQTLKNLCVYRFGRPYWNIKIVEDLFGGRDSFPERDFYKTIGIEDISLPKSSRDGISALNFIDEIKFARERKNCLKICEDYISEFEATDLKYRTFRQNISSQPHRKLASGFEYLFTSYYEKTATLYFKSLFNAMTCLGELKTTIDKINPALWNDHDFKNLLLSIDGSLHFELQDRVVDLLKNFKEFGKDSSEFINEKERFIDHFYYLSNSDDDISSEKLGDDQHLFERFIEQLSKEHHPVRDVRGFCSSCVDDNEPLLKNFLDKIGASSPFMLKAYNKRKFESVLENFSAFQKLKRDLKIMMMRSFYIMRSNLLQLSENFVDLNYFDSTQDIFLLQIDEVLELCRGEEASDLLKDKIKYRSQIANSFIEFPAPKFFGDKVYKEDWDKVTYSMGGTVRGVNASRGTFKGKVKVVPHLNTFSQIDPDCILVTKSISPRLLYTMGMIPALITEYGNSYSFVGVEARVNQVPAVVNVSGATALFQDGQELVVDGDTGQVTFVK